MFANPRIAELLGTAPAEMDGRPMVDFCFREDIEDGRERLATNLAGETEEFEFRFRRADGTPLHVLAATAPLKGRDGAIIGALGGYLDLTERKKAEERQRVLMREVTHRGKNLLAVVQSIASRTLATGRTIEDARQAFLGRLQALGRTYSSLTDEQFEGALLDEIVAAELRPFGARAEISGPRIMLAARVAQTFGLVVHELATNAVKYGALSVPKGRIAVAWRVDGTGAGARFRFEWTERNGPPASEPVRKGFGSTLISVVASAEFKCAPMISFGADGFRYRLDAVLADVGSVIDESPVRGKLQSETLRDFYDAWANLAVGGRLPTLKRFPRARFSATGGLTVVEIDSSLGVRQLESGRALTEKVGRLVPDGALAGDDPDSMMEAYRRCARSRMPCYEHLRFDFGDGHVVTFERLLVPFSRGGRRVTHLAGLVVYTGRTTPGRARPRSDASGSRD